MICEEPNFKPANSAGNSILMNTTVKQVAYIPLSGMTRGIQRTRWIMRYQGIGATGLTAAVKLLMKCGIDLSRSLWYTQFKSQRFDKMFRVETSESVPVSQLDIDADQKQHAVEYIATSSTELNLILSGLQIAHEDYTFVDFGSGKGRALLMASEFPFQKICGVELSPNLHKIATRNIANFRSRTQRCQNVNSMCTDATKFNFPNKPLVLYFYNPFGEAILKQVLSRLKDSVAENPRDVFVIYHNPVHREILDHEPFFEKVSSAEDEEWAIYHHAVSNVPRKRDFSAQLSPYCVVRTA